MSESLSLKRLKENSPKDLNQLCEILIDLIQDLIDNPNNSKYKKLEIDSDLIASKLMPFSGGLELLFEIGYEEGDDYFYLPDNFSKEKLNFFLANLKSILNPKPICSLNSDSICASTIVSTRSNFGLKNSKNSIFANRLNSSYQHVLIYEDVDLKQKCLSKIPIERLRDQAEQKYQIYSQNNQDKQPFNTRDFLILELLSWFKNEFFKWINQPDCIRCNSNEKMSFIKNDRPNHNEATWQAGNVEVYRCTTCNELTRFPRYNHPSKLLETRGGRCGEWANCFCLILRSLDFDARYILDWTDHVWCEVYSESQQRWLHADPCENTLDKPLLYEHGWNKQLSYIIAFSRYECLDVTWRYSVKHKEVLKRRNECDEAWLVYYTNELTKQRINLVDKNQRDLRLISEIVEFLTPKKAKEGEDLGRQSGSLQWRIDRGEIQCIPEIKNGHKFLVKSSPFRVKYNTVNNIYLIEESSGLKEVLDWKKMTYKYSNIRHKIEHDWKMCYLEREKGPDMGFIEWYFELDKFKVKQIELVFNWSVFETGEVKIKILNMDQNGAIISDLILDKNKIENSNDIIKYVFDKDKFLIDLKHEYLNGILLRVELSKGDGRNSFQHAQLFRQSLNDINQYLFDISFY